MAVRSKAWEQVGERFESLGDHLRTHFDEVNTQAAAERAAFEKSIRGLLSALEDGFGAARKVVRDPILRQDVTEVANSVREAMLATFEGAGEQVRERLNRPVRAVRPTRKQVVVPKQAAAEKPAAAKPSATPKRAAPRRKTTARKTTKGATPRKRAAG